MNTSTTTNKDMTAAAPAATEESRSRLRQSEHAHCFACGTRAQDGLNLNFSLCDDGTVSASWCGSAQWQSYDGIVHGGILATLMDSAMVHVLFARGISARTGELVLRYRRAVSVGVPVRVTARLSQAYARLYFLEAEVHQDGLLCVQAKSKFMSTGTRANEGRG